MVIIRDKMPISETELKEQFAELIYNYTGQAYDKSMSETLSEIFFLELTSLKRAIHENPSQKSSKIK